MAEFAVDHTLAEVAEVDATADALSGLRHHARHAQERVLAVADLTLDEGLRLADVRGLAHSGTLRADLQRSQAYRFAFRVSQVAIEFVSPHHGTFDRGTGVLRRPILARGRHGQR